MQKDGEAWEADFVNDVNSDLQDVQGLMSIFACPLIANNWQHRLSGSLSCAVFYFLPPMSAEDFQNQMATVNCKSGGLAFVSNTLQQKEITSPGSADSKSSGA